MYWKDEAGVIRCRTCGAEFGWPHWCDAVLPK